MSFSFWVVYLLCLLIYLLFLLFLKQLAKIQYFSDIWKPHTHPTNKKISSCCATLCEYDYYLWGYVTFSFSGFRKVERCEAAHRLVMMAYFAVVMCKFGLEKWCIYIIVYNRENLLIGGHISEDKKTYIYARNWVYTTMDRC